MTVFKSAAQLEHENEVITVKTLRRDIDEQLQKVKAMSKSMERSLAMVKLTESIMWLGMDLKRLGEANPYPSSKDPAITTIEPTADGLKL